MADQTRSGQDESAGPGVGLPLPPPPPQTFAEILLLIERNRMDNMRVLEAIERNTSHVPRAAESGEGSGRQPTHPDRYESDQPSCYN